MNKEFNQYSWEHSMDERLTNLLDAERLIENNLQAKEHQDQFDKLMAEFIRVPKEQKIKKLLFVRLREFASLITAAKKSYMEGK